MPSRKGREMHHMIMWAISDGGDGSHPPARMVLMCCSRHIRRRAPRYECAGLGREVEYGWILVRGTHATTRVSLDHPLGCQKLLNLLSQFLDAIILLQRPPASTSHPSTRTTRVTHPHPIGTFCTETKTLETQTNACLTVALCVGLLVAFLARSARGEQKYSGNNKKFAGTGVQRVSNTRT